MTRFIEAAETGEWTTRPLSDVAEYAYVAVTPPGRQMVHVAGACPLDADGTTVAVGDVAGQAAACIANLEQALAAAKATLSDIVKSTVYVQSTEQGELVAAWEIYRDAISPHRPPSTLLGVAALGYDDQLVEIEATAMVAVPGEKGAA